MSFTPLPAAAPVDEDALRARIARGLRLITVPFPYLSGLAAATRVTLDSRLPTMGVFASGRMIANPQFVARLNDSDLAFVLAHEMLHLALRTHDRLRGSDPLEFNYAHDYIINDMLRVALGRTTIPADGLDMAGARHRSAEDIVLEMRRNADGSTRTRVWEGNVVTARAVRRRRPRRRRCRRRPVRAPERTLFPDDMTDPDARRRPRASSRRAPWDWPRPRRAMGAGRGSDAGGPAASRRRVAWSLSHAVGARPAALARVGGAGRAHVHARIAARRAARRRRACPGEGAKAGSSTSCSTPAAR